MLGDGAIAVNPKDERYASIIGKYCEIPVGPKEHRRLIPIIADEYPDPDFGSGAVKITGAHDFNDYQVARRNNIPLYRLMDTKGRMRSDGAPYKLSLIHISEPTRPYLIAYAVFCLKKNFFNDTATTEIYTLLVVGSVRCV